MNASTAQAAQPVGRLGGDTRGLLAAFVVLTAVATAVLYVSAERTDEFWAWAIQPSATAAFLGGGYATGLFGVATLVRARRWAPLWMGLAAILVFVAATTVATVMHLDKFHFGAEGFTARFVAWAWLVVYLVVPVWILAVLIRNRAHRPPGPAGAGPGWPRAYAALLQTQAAVLLGVGIALFAAPESTQWLWPWELSPLTARTSAAWLLFLAASALLLAQERDLTKLDAVLLPYTAFAVLQAAVLIRFHQQVEWGRPAAALLVGLLAVILATGVTGIALIRRRLPGTDGGAMP